jgi:hypothetical protein
MSIPFISKRPPSLVVKRLSCEEQAIMSIQATIRGALIRRKSVIKNPFEQIASMSYSTDLMDSSNPLVILNHSNLKQSSSILNSKPNFLNLNCIPEYLSDNNIDSSNSFSHDEVNSKHVNSIRLNSSNSSDSTLTSSAQSSPKINTKVLVLRGDSSSQAVVRFIGETKFAPGKWIGVELDQPTGKNNGSVQEHCYFKCPNKYGLFVREECIKSHSHAKSIIAANKAKLSTDRKHIEISQPTTTKHITSTFNHSTINSLRSNREAVLRGMKKISYSSDSKENNKYAENLRSSSFDNSNKMRTSGMKKKSTLNDLQKDNLVTAISSPSNIKIDNQLKINSFLKLKLSQMMELLNQELDIVNEIEQTHTTNLANNNNSQNEKVFEDILSLTLQEIELLESFKIRLLLIEK